MEALDDAGQANFSATVMAYRIAHDDRHGVVVTVGATLGWFASYLSSAALLFCSPFTILYSFKSEKEKKPFLNLMKLFLEGKILSSC